MPITRIHKSNNYSIVSNLLLDNTILSDSATLLLLRMLRKPDDWHFSVQKLCEEYGTNKNKISRSFKELKEKKFLKIDQIKTHGTFEYVYHVHEIPYDCIYDEEGRIVNKETGEIMEFNQYKTSMKTDRLSKACTILGKVFSRHGGFLGTAQQLVDLIPEKERNQFTAKTIGKTLRAIEAELQQRYELIIEFKKTKTARWIAVYYEDEESPFLSDKMEGDITVTQNRDTVLSPSKNGVTSPRPKIGIPEMGTIIITDNTKNEDNIMSLENTIAEDTLDNENIMHSIESSKLDCNEDILESFDEGSIDTTQSEENSEITNASEDSNNSENQKEEEEDLVKENPLNPTELDFYDEVGCAETSENDYYEELEKHEDPFRFLDAVKKTERYLDNEGFEKDVLESELLYYYYPNWLDLPAEERTMSLKHVRKVLNQYLSKGNSHKVEKNHQMTFLESANTKYDSECDKEPLVTNTRLNIIVRTENPDQLIENSRIREKPSHQLNADDTS